jgi:hypothetical protein
LGGIASPHSQMLVWYSCLLCRPHRHRHRSTKCRVVISQQDTWQPTRTRYARQAQQGPCRRIDARTCQHKMLEKLTLSVSQRT